MRALYLVGLPTLVVTVAVIISFASTKSRKTFTRKGIVHFALFVILLSLPSPSVFLWWRLAGFIYCATVLLSALSLLSIPVISIWRPPRYTHLGSGPDIVFIILVFSSTILFFIAIPVVVLPDFHQSLAVLYERKNVSGDISAKKKEINQIQKELTNQQQKLKKMQELANLTQNQTLNLSRFVAA